MRAWSSISVNQHLIRNTLKVATSELHKKGLRINNALISPFTSCNNFYHANYPYVNVNEQKTYIQYDTSITYIMNID